MIKIDYITFESKRFKTTTIRVNADDLEILRAIAKEDNRSLNYLINKIIKEHLIHGFYKENDFSINEEDIIEFNEDIMI